MILTKTANNAFTFKCLWNMLLWGMYVEKNRISVDWATPISHRVVCMCVSLNTHTHVKRLSGYVCVRILINCSQLSHKVSSIISIYTHGEREAQRQRGSYPSSQRRHGVHLDSEPTSIWLKVHDPPHRMSQLREEHLPGPSSVVASPLGALHIPGAHQPITDQVSPSSIHGGLSGL